MAGHIRDNEVMIAVTFKDPDLLGKLFPDLYPDGTGYWKPTGERQSFSFAKYVKWTIHHEDSRWRGCLRYLTMSFDKLEKMRIHSETMRKARESQVRAAVSLLNENGNYYNEDVALPIPASLRTGDVYWNKQRSNLSTMIKQLGEPHFFLTLTCNEYGWEDVRQLVSFVANKPIEDIRNDDFINYPVEVTRHFLRRFHYIMKNFILNSTTVFPSPVSDYWWRLESQSRGSLHVHMIIWLEEVPDNVSEWPISTQMPAEDPLRSFVVKYQLHQCTQARCSCQCNFVAANCTCTEGFPKPVSEVTELSADGKRWRYKRRNGYDQYITPFHPKLIQVSDSVMDIQRCTGHGVARYLAKYCAKAEPTQEFEADGGPSAQQHIRGRRVGIPELYLHLSGSHAVQSSRSIVQVALFLPSTRERAVKPLHQLQTMDESDTDVFVDGALEKYMDRPDELENTTILDYYKKYDILVASRSERRNATVIHDRKQRRVQRAKEDHVVRILPFCKPAGGEQYYFQLLLLTQPFREVPVLQPNQTYRDLCRDRGLLNVADLPSNDQPISILNIALDQLDPDRTTGLSQEDFRNYLELYNNATPEVNLDTAIDRLTNSQYLVLQGIVQRHFDRFFITGGAGTGKSFLVKVLTQVWNTSGEAYCLLGTTGRAAYAIGGTTVHSFFAIPPNRLTSLCFTNTTVRDRVKAVDIFLIDECSMLSAELLDLLNDILQQIHSNTEPMGGKQFILVGDFLQLKPVDGGWIFNSDSWRHFKPVVLQENMRQNGDTEFQRLLNEIRLGRCSDASVQLLQSRMLPPPEDIKAVHLMSNNSSVKEFNQQHLLEDRIRIHSIDTTSPLPPSSYLDSECPLQTTLEICRGALVMLVHRNINFSEGLVNGAIAVVLGWNMANNIVHTIRLLLLGGSPRTYDLKRISWTYSQNDQRLVREQFPLQLAFAMTIHKSQGMTLNAVCVDLGDTIFAAGQAYVALSRAKSLNTLFLSNFNVKSIQADPAAIRAHEEVTEQGKRTLEELQSTSQQRRRRRFQ
jgi:hypothetical protein